MFEWLIDNSESDGLSRKRELDVTIGVWYDEDSENFLVGYGAQNQVDNLGIASSLNQAVKNLAENISKAGRDYTKIRRKIDSASECSLGIRVYYTKPDDDYVVELTDGTGGNVSGVGHKMSSAVEDLAGRVSVKRRA